MIRQLTELHRLLTKKFEAGLGPSITQTDCDNWMALTPATIRLTWVSKHPTGLPTIPNGHKCNCPICGSVSWSVHAALNELAGLERWLWQCQICNAGFITSHSIGSTFAHA